mgnify:FL=1
MLNGDTMINGVFSFTINEKKVSFILFNPIPEEDKKSFMDWFKEKIKDMKISNYNTIYFHTKKKKQIEILFNIEKLDK